MVIFTAELVSQYKNVGKFRYFREPAFYCKSNVVSGNIPPKQGARGAIFITEKVTIECMTAVSAPNGSYCSD